VLVSIRGIPTGFHAAVVKSGGEVVKNRVKR
jgi:hypothetical protein